MDIHKLESWMLGTKWKVVWTPDRLHKLPSIKDLHEHWIEFLYKTYPFMKRQLNREEAFSNLMQIIACNISSTLPKSNIQHASVEDIEDLEAYIAYINNGSVLNDGVHNIKRDVIVAEAPEKKNGLPWFGRVINVYDQQHELRVRWMDRQQSKTIYFFLTDEEAIVHFETVICNGVQMEPLLGDKLMWKLITPLSFLQSMNTDSPPEIQQNSTKLVPYQRRKKFDLSQMLFASSEEFLQFAKVLL